MSVARSLGRAGVVVHALGQASAPVRRSRFCATFTDVGAGPRPQERLLERLQGHSQPSVLLPCDDEALELVARHRSTLVALGHRPVEADDEVLLAMLDKERTYALARIAGVPTPRTHVVRTEADAADAATRMDFPCALKPLRSHIFARHFRAKVLVARDRDELLAAFARTLALGVDMLVTEIVPGREDEYHSYYSYLDERGQPLAHFTKRKFRQWPTAFGLACYQASHWSEEAAELGLRFFQGVGLRGLGNVEFKRDARDGQLKLIECNHRFTAANELLMLAGVDLPLLAYNRLVGRPAPPLGDYRKGVRMWHPIEDVRAGAAYVRDGELTPFRYVRSLMHRQHFTMLRLDDPGPTLASVAAKGRRAVGRRLRRWARSRAPDDTRERVAA